MSLSNSLIYYKILRISIIEKELKNHKYRVSVCQKVYGSMGGYCDEIVIQFNTRDFERDDVTIGKDPLYIDYLGDKG